MIKNLLLMELEMISICLENWLMFPNDEEKEKEYIEELQFLYHSMKEILSLHFLNEYNHRDTLKECRKVLMYLNEVIKPETEVNPLLQNE